MDCHLFGIKLLLWKLKLIFNMSKKADISKNNEELVKEKLYPKRLNGTMVTISNCSKGLCAIEVSIMII